MTKATSFRLSETTARQLAWLAPRYSKNQTTIVTVAIDRLFVQEGGTMVRMSYEAPLEEIDAAVFARAQAVHAEVCGCDNKRCTLTGEIYEWLMAGDKGEGATIEEITRDWREYTDFA